MQIGEMTLEDLIELYIQQVNICNNIDYNDKRTILAYNKATDTMYEIVELIKAKFGATGIKLFSSLLDMKENSIQRWVAPQLLERMPIDEYTKVKALTIIKDLANGNDIRAMGFRIWLRDWTSKTNK